MTDETRLLFVYGTLRPALARGEPEVLIRGLTCLGPATVRGSLYDLGSYPGFVAGDGLVHGELLIIDSPTRLAAIDAYEECDGPDPLYVREQVLATRPDASVVKAWTYRFLRSVIQSRHIPAGNYAADRSERTNPAH
jgi:gamma-glutamylcyclotransferase (GGCT)/AIG2-like uncharacterized protein YtfP